MEEENNDPLKRILEMMEKHQKVSALIEAKTDKKEEEAEKEVLMRLWADLGNSRHSYYMAMQAVGFFMYALREMRKVNELPDDLAILVTKALAECARMDAECLSIVQKVKSENNLDDE